jgi:hypothetical protein
MVVETVIKMTTFRPCLVQKKFAFLFFRFFEQHLRFLGFPKIAFSSSQNTFDLNVVPDQPETWRPSFLSKKGYFMTNDSMMLDDVIVASVAKGIITL